MERIGEEYRKEIRRRRRRFYTAISIIVVMFIILATSYFYMVTVVWRITNSPPSVTLVSPPHNSYISNNTGYVNFTWVSSDPDNDTLFHYFMIDATSALNSPLFEGYHTGQKTYYNYTNLSDGSYWWRVEVSDLSTYNVSETWHLVVHNNINNSIPFLEHPLVYPHEGTPQTNFTYYVDFVDPDNDTPSYIYVVIDGVRYAMSKYNTSDNDSTDGIKYYYTTTLPVGNHTFAMYASDGIAVASTPLQYEPKVYTEGSAYLNHPPVVTLKYPPNAGSVTTANVTFRWTTIDVDNNLVRQEVWLYKNTVNAPRQVFDINSGETINNLKRGTYYWCVIAYDTYTSTKSDLWSFFVDIPGKQNKITIQPENTETYRGGKFTGKLIITNEGSANSYEVYWYIYLKKDNVTVDTDSGALALTTTAETSYKLNVPFNAEIGNYTIEAYTYDKTIDNVDKTNLGHDSIDVAVLSSSLLSIPSQYVVPLLIIMIVLSIFLIGYSVRHKNVYVMVLGIASILFTITVSGFILLNTVTLIGIFVICFGVLLFAKPSAFTLGNYPATTIFGLLLTIVGIVLYMSGLIGL